MSEWYNFSRKTYRDQINVKVTVYRYQIRSRYSLITNDQDVIPLRVPARGTKFLFIWVKTISNSSTPMGGYNYGSFKVHYKGQTIRPRVCLDRIYELIGYYDLNHNYQTAPYGYYWGRDYEEGSKNPAWKYIEHEAFLPGTSNYWDGYILFDIPLAATPRDLTVSADFDGMFHARWQFEGADKFSLARPPVRL